MDSPLVDSTVITHVLSPQTARFFPVFLIAVQWWISAIVIGWEAVIFEGL